MSPCECQVSCLYVKGWRIDRELLLSLDAAAVDGRILAWGLVMKNRFKI